MKKLLTLAATLMLTAACASPSSPLPAPPPAGNAAANAVPAVTPNLATPNADAQKRIEAARAAINARNYALAVTEAEAAVQADPGASNTHYLLGNAYNQSASVEADAAIRNDLFNKSAGAYQRAVAINANNTDALHNLGTVYYQLGRLPEARAQLEAALKLEPNDAKSHYTLGSIFVQEDPGASPGSLARAEEEFLAALKYDPNLAVAHVGLTQVYLTKGDPKKALEYAQKGIALSGADVDPFTYWQLAQAQCAAGDKTGGIATLEKVRAANVPDAGFNSQVLQLMTSCKGN
jgi:tetratricopeptide (TPR) repeat protein